MEEQIENQNSLNTDVDETENTDETGEDGTAETTDDSAQETSDDKALALEEKNKKLFERAKKAEDELKALKSKPQPKAETSPEVASRIEQLERDSLGDINDELWDEVKSYSQLKGLSLKKAFNSDYIQFQVEKSQKQQREEEASISNSSKPSKPAVKDYSKAKPEDFDTSTEEGQKDWEAYKAYNKMNK